jgi:hypothetical protein
MTKGHDGLPRLAETHVIGEDRAPASEQERDAFDLMWEKSVAERNRLPVGPVQVGRRQVEQLRERARLCIELVAG